LIQEQVFLLFQNLDIASWGKTLSDSRSAYSTMKEHFLKDIENPEDLSTEDPLTDTETVSPTVLKRYGHLHQRQRCRLTSH